MRRKERDDDLGGSATEETAAALHPMWDEFEIPQQQTQSVCLNKADRDSESC